MFRVVGHPWRNVRPKGVAVESTLLKSPLQEGIHHLTRTPKFFAIVLLRARAGATALRHRAC